MQNYYSVKGLKSWGLTTKPCHIAYRFDLEAKGQCISIKNVLNTSSRRDRRMCKYILPMSRLTEVIGRAWRHDKSLYIWPSGQRSTSNREHKCTWTSSHGDRPMCEYVKPMSYQKIVIGRTHKHDKTPINLTSRSKFKVVSGSWKYATHRLKVIHPCAKYGTQM